MLYYFKIKMKNIIVINIKTAQAVKGIFIVRLIAAWIRGDELRSPATAMPIKNVPLIY